ncbi:MAG: hypothetical protein JKY01_09410 [Pseudomonadales bacterium]|nr:hypothetical protein [Pseudomonadales bacterium]
MTRPDGRVDPNGKTFRYLTMYLSIDEQSTIKNGLLNGTPVSKKIQINKQRIIDANGLLFQKVIYKNTIKTSERIVSEYSKAIIKVALKEAGMTVAVMTSTIRTPEEQSKIMLRNAKINLQKQYDLYGEVGKDVLKEYENNQKLSDKEVITLMVAKIKERERSGKRVSLHVCSEEAYKQLNIIDIGLASTQQQNKNFNKEKFTKALDSLHKEGYIERHIDETNKSNNCWHIEIKVGKKPIYNDISGSILNQLRYIA